MIWMWCAMMGWRVKFFTWLSVKVRKKKNRDTNRKQCADGWILVFIIIQLTLNGEQYSNNLQFNNYPATQKHIISAYCSPQLTNKLKVLQSIKRAKWTTITKKERREEKKNLRLPWSKTNSWTMWSGCAYAFWFSAIQWSFIICFFSIHFSIFTHSFRFERRSAGRTR